MATVPFTILFWPFALNSLLISKDRMVKELLSTKRAILELSPGLVLVRPSTYIHDGFFSFPWGMYLVLSLTELDFLTI